VTDAKDAIAKLRALLETRERAREALRSHRSADLDLEYSRANAELCRGTWRALPALLAVAEAAEKLSGWQVAQCDPHERDRARLVDALAEFAKVQL